jgi:hypothetical protein
MNGEIGVVYLLHFDRPFSHAKHYTGFAGKSTFEARIAHHRNGTSGAKLMDAIYAAGIGFKVAKTEYGSRSRERQLKARGASRRCPICKVENHEV